jgi:carboxypeptidase Taq
VPNNTLGVLQDTHWAIGAIGYFSTYALGNLISAQLWERIGADLPELEDDFERGEFGALREWLRENVHRYGRTYTPAELLERATGAKAIDAGPYVRYLQRKIGDIYGLPSPAA